MHVRFCVACQEEYRPEIAYCADCGGPLEDRHDDEVGESDEASVPVPDAHRSFPDAQPLARSAEARALVPLADRLLAAGIEFRIAPVEVGGEDRPRSFELQVRRDESDAALEAVADLEGPDSGVTLLVVRVSGGTEDTEAGLRCPGCDTEVDGSAAECPECGLGLSG